jgi:hypothetical protein
MWREYRETKCRRWARSEKSYEAGYWSLATIMSGLCNMAELGLYGDS